MGKFMSNREKLQYTLTFITDLISLGCSVFLTLIVFDYWLKLIPSYE